MDIIKEKIIYSKQMAECLMSLGFVPIRVERNQTRPEFFIWVFQDNDYLQSAIHLYTRILHNTRNKNLTKEVKPNEYERQLENHSFSS